MVVIRFCGPVVSGILPSSLGIWLGRPELIQPRQYSVIGFHHCLLTWGLALECQSNVADFDINFRTLVCYEMREG